MRPGGVDEDAPDPLTANEPQPMPPPYPAPYIGETDRSRTTPDELGISMPGPPDEKP
jgi:hypothetical protein